MKLLSYTYRKLALLLFLLMAVWGVLFYYAIIDEVVDETDDTLENYGEILMESALHDPSILETEGSLMSFYKFTPISEEEGRHYRQVFYDATVYIELEDEDEPVRVMRTAFRMPDGQFYELTLMISILERDDMVEAMLWYLGAEGVFVGSGIFASGNPAKRAQAIVKAVTNYTDAAMLAELSTDLGEAMVGINEAEIELLMAERGK